VGEIVKSLSDGLLDNIVIDSEINDFLIRRLLLSEINIRTKSARSATSIKLRRLSWALAQNFIKISLQKIRMFLDDPILLKYIELEPRKIRVDSNSPLWKDNYRIALLFVNRYSIDFLKYCRVRKIVPNQEEVSLVNPGPCTLEFIIELISHRGHIPAEVYRSYVDDVINEIDFEAVVFGLRLFSDSFEKRDDRVFIRVRDFLELKRSEVSLKDLNLYGGFIRLNEDDSRALLEDLILTKMKPFLKFKKKRRMIPPCIEKLITDLKNGRDLSHFERFAIASYLIHFGWEIDKIVDLFRHAPDFDEETTRYQIEHIAGLRGRKEKYRPPSCRTLKVAGLCTNECR